MSQKTEFLPFHAINEFMRPDFRLTIIRDTLTSQINLPESFQNDLNEKIKKRVSIPGFRSSDKAPALMKVLPTSKAFEKNPDLVASIISCWVETQTELRLQVYNLLKSRNWRLLEDSDFMNIDSLSNEIIKEWPIFPLNINRAKLPGFFTHWPSGENFETLYGNFTALYPEATSSIDKVSLMVVWLSMRLPYHIDEPLNASLEQETNNT
jgi:hypothetical protein